MTTLKVKLPSRPANQSSRSKKRAPIARWGTRSARLKRSMKRSVLSRPRRSPSLKRAPTWTLKSRKTSCHWLSGLKSKRSMRQLGKLCDRTRMLAIFTWKRYTTHDCIGIYLRKLRDWESVEVMHTIWQQIKKSGSKWKPSVLTSN